MLYSELDKQKTARSAPAAVPQASSHRSLQASQHSKTPISHGAAHLLHSSTLPAAARAAIEWLLRIRQAQRRGGNGPASRELWIFQKKGEILDNDVIVSHISYPLLSSVSPDLNRVSALKSRRSYSGLLRVFQE
jgi:hypothetical protein